MCRAVANRGFCVWLVIVLVLVAMGTASCGSTEPGESEPGEPVVAEPDPEDTEPEPEEPTETENRNMVPNVLTGIDTDEELLERRPFLISIDNHVGARPQSGLSRADLLYELPVEGGITRFLGVFWTQDVDKIGPVRSARHYHIDLVMETQGIEFLTLMISGARQPTA